MPWSAVTTKRTEDRALRTIDERRKKVILRLSDERYRLFAAKDLSRNRIETDTALFQECVYALGCVHHRQPPCLLGLFFYSCLLALMQGERLMPRCNNAVWIGSVLAL
jgi:hypothetical protein